MAKNGYRVMDSDLHTMEPDDLWDRYLEEPYRSNPPQIIHDAGAAQNQPAMIVQGHTIPAFRNVAASVRPSTNLYERARVKHPHMDVAYARGFDAESHIQAMDIEGIDVAVLYGTRGRQILMHDDLDPDYAAALARAYNNWMYDFCRHNPERLRMAGQISFHDVDHAVAEARRCVEELGAVAIVGNPNPVNDRHIHDPYWDPLWAEIERLDVPVGFHPTGVSALRDDIARRFIGHPGHKLIGGAGRNPIELMLALASFCSGGVLERHPKLQCAFLEGTCGWVPWWLWRLDEFWEKFGPGSDVDLSMKPSDFFVRQCYVATDADEIILPDVIRRIGDDRIVVSTDYPHADGLFPVAIESFVNLEEVSDENKRKILWDNCARLYPRAATPAATATAT